MNEEKKISRIAIIGAMDNEILHLKETIENGEMEMAGPGKTLKVWKGNLGKAEVICGKERHWKGKRCTLHADTY